ncbi:MAG TPA: signal recognition particle-docking protein FtsY [Conexivisphaerales archaeon]|nr:signal recognition particle-docking protein FtsY [Conexivisphaerales archaeon]
MFDRLRKAIEGFKESVTTRTLSEKELSSALDEFEVALLESEVALEAVESVEASIKKELVGTKVERGSDLQKLVDSALRSSLLKLFPSEAAIDLEGRIREKRESKEPYVVVFLGINGTGKTTSIAKLAHKLTGEGFKVLLAAADTYRAGAIEQLETHAERLGLKSIHQRYGADPAAVARDSVLFARQHNFDVVLVDTAGRMQTSKNLMDELGKVVRVAQPDLKVFVGDALAGNDLINQAREFHDRIGFDAVILAKADADVKGGAAVSVAYVTKTPILYLGVGQSYDDLQPFDSGWVVDKILS